MKPIKKYLSQKPWKIATDILFILLILMLVIPSTRSVLLSGVAGVRTLVLPLESKEKGKSLDEAGWNWTMTDMEGKKSSFADFRGEVIFLNQWATWCPPCRAEMPSIEKLYKKNGGNIRFVMLTNEEPQKVRSYLQKEGYTFPVYIGQIGGSDLASRTIPSTTIIDPAGKIRVHKAGAFNWNSGKVRRLLGSLK